jgi:hypothetical protein
VRALLLGFVLVATHVSGAEPVRVRASVAYAPCLEPALAAFTAESRVATALDVAEPGSARGADLVVGDDAELTALLEGGTLVGETATDLGTLPWVRVGPETAAAGAADLVVLGGAVGREVRARLGRARPVTDAGELRAANRRVVPRSLAGPGEHRLLDVRPLVATAAVVRGGTRVRDAERLLAWLSGPRGEAALGSCLAPVHKTSQAAGQLATYATAVVDWWLPRCTLERNMHNDPQETVGGPDAARLGPDRYRGMFSLGQGGYVVVDAGVTVVNGPGADVRVYQTTSGEPVTLYAASSPQGPFVPLALREYCGVRSAGFFSMNCEFDLAAAGLSEARYLKVEDGELYPCLAGGTASEGADIDAVQILNFR